MFPIRSSLINMFLITFPHIRNGMRDGLLTYIVQLKIFYFSSNPDDYLKKVHAVSFDIIHKQCRGDTQQFIDKHYQTVSVDDLKKMPQRERKKTVGSCVSSERKDLYVKKKLAFDHLLIIKF